MNINQIVDFTKHPIMNDVYAQSCRQILDRDGALVLHDFLKPQAIDFISQEGNDNRHKAYFCVNNHNVYLSPSDPEYLSDHPRNKEVVSSKGCICDDVISDTSPIKTLYDDEGFKTFLCGVLGEEALYDYADPLSSTNLHYAEPGQELGWHFDNSSFAITLMIQPPQKGGSFDYVSNVRNSDKADMNFAGVEEVLQGNAAFESLSLGAGALTLFRGRDSIHRVAPVEGNQTRMLVVLAYNSQPNVALSQSARMAFYGRLD